MSYDRRATIYVQSSTLSRLLNTLKLYPQTTREQSEFSGGVSIAERKLTADELAERIISEAIKEKYPLVAELEKALAKAEREVIEKAKQ